MKWRFKCPDGAGGRFVSGLDFDSEPDTIAALATFRLQASKRSRSESTEK
jgi:hypothetical protein